MTSAFARRAETVAHPGDRASATNNTRMRSEGEREETERWRGMVGMLQMTMRRKRRITSRGRIKRSGGLEKGGGGGGMLHTSSPIHINMASNTSANHVIHVTTAPWDIEDSSVSCEGVHGFGNLSMFPDK